MIDTTQPHEDLDRLARLTQLRKPAALLLAAAAMLLAMTSASVAEESWGYALGHDLMSPFCPGRTLATCPSPNAAELVQWIVMQEASGVTKEQVIEMLIERFGEEILGAPPAEGITLWAYIFPVLGFVVGGGIAFIALRRIVADRQPGVAVAVEAPGPIPTSPNPTGEQMDADLARIVDADLELRA